MLQRRQRVRKMSGSKKSIERLEKIIDEMLERQRVDVLEKRVQYLEGIALANGIEV